MARGKEETRQDPRSTSKVKIQWWFYPPSTTQGSPGRGAKGPEVDKKDRTRPSKLKFDVICTTVTVGLYGLRRMPRGFHFHCHCALRRLFRLVYPVCHPPSFSTLSPIYDQDENESTKRSQTTPLAEWCPRGSNSGSFAGSFQLGRSLFRTLNCW